MRTLAPEEGEPSDEALLAGMANGDEWATVVFVRRFQRRVFGLAHAMLGDRSAAEDVAQEALTRVGVTRRSSTPGAARSQRGSSRSHVTSRSTRSGSGGP